MPGTGGAARRQHGADAVTDAWRPAVNLYETEGAYLICVDLAGMDEKDIEVSLEKSTLTVRGRRVSPMPPDGSRAVAVHLMEIDHGRFYREIKMPENADIENADAIQASYRGGFLWVRIPKKMGVV